jgi:hypothetical protein
MKNSLERTMNSEIAREPIRFAQRFLEKHGSVIEATPEGFEALLPHVLSKTLKLPEYVSIKEGLKAEDEGQYGVAYGSPLLEKMVELASDPLPLASCRLSFSYLKSQGFDRLIQDQFSFHKSLCRVTSTAPIKTDYLNLTCRYVARSDEQKEGLISFFFNFETGAVIPQISNLFSNAVMEAAPLPESVRAAGRWERILQGIPRESRDMIHEEIRDFRDSMNRRLRRDVNNLEEYYETLKKEMELSLGRSGLSGRLVQDRKEKIALIPDELAKKKEDLLQKYSIRIKITPCAGLLIRTPAVKILCEVHMGREKKPLSLIYDPMTKALDPLLCEGCHRSITSISFCPRHHALCSRCQEKCPVCQS